MQPILVLYEAPFRNNFQKKWSCGGYDPHWTTNNLVLYDKLSTIHQQGYSICRKEPFRSESLVHQQVTQLAVKYHISCSSHKGPHN